MRARRLLCAIAILAVTASATFAQTQVRTPRFLPNWKDLKYSELPPIKVPEPVSVTLRNGLKIYLLEDHELPIVSGFALIRTGNLFDPNGKHGLAGITGSVLRSGGTAKESGDQIDVRLENIAASVESQIGESSGTLSFSCLRENTNEVLQVFHDVMTAPEFRQDKVDLEKTQYRSAISRRNDDANGIATREFTNLIYGRNTPYGWMIEYSDVESIQRQDVIGFYKRYYFPANMTIAVYGDFNAQALQAELTRLFGDWNYSQPPVPKFPQVQQTPVPGVFLATKTDVTQTFFEIGHLGGIFSDKDYPALEVAADILGGGFNSRLFQRIRTQLGYAYNIGSAWGASYDHPGLFQISGSTQSQYTVPTLRAIREELDKMRTTPVSDDELKTAKDTVLNSFVFFFDRPSKTLNRIMMYQYFGYPKDFIFQYQKAVGSVTKADVLRVAQRYLKPQDLTVVAVGNPSDFKVPMTELGLKVQPLDLTIPEPKQEQVAASSASLAGGKALLERVQKALGGADKLEAVKDIQADAAIEVTTPQGAMKAVQHNSIILPSQQRQTLDLPFGKQTTYSNGKTGWIAAPQGVQNMPAEVLKQASGELFRQLETIVLSDRAPDRTVNLVNDSTLEISDKNGNTVQLAIDPKTYLPSHAMYQGNAMGGPPVQVEEDYSDWRNVNGIQEPFKVTILQAGKKFADVTVQTYKINSGLTEDVLSKKP